MSKHTAGPWTYCPPVLDDESGFVGAMTGDGYAVTSLADRPGMMSAAQFEANAARIVACVNALEGIDDPAAFMAAVRPLIGNAAGLSMLIDTDDPAAEVALIGEQGVDLYRMINP